MVAELAVRLDDDQIEPQRQTGQVRAVGQTPEVPEREAGSVEVRALAVVNGLLGQAEIAACPPANLDGDEGGGRARVNREDVDLGAADANVRIDHAPAEGREVRGDSRLRVVTGSLRGRPHPGTMRRRAYPRITSRSPAHHLALTRTPAGGLPRRDEGDEPAAQHEPGAPDPAPRPLHGHGR